MRAIAAILALAAQAGSPQATRPAGRTVAQLSAATKDADAEVREYAKQALAQLPAK